MGDSIRSGNLHDLERLQEIEKAAGLAFREVGMHAIAKDEPLPLEVLADYNGGGIAGSRPITKMRSWVTWLSMSWMGYSTSSKSRSKG
jgi:hypothetical protein